jgi:hypothetical protein
MLDAIQFRILYPPDSSLKLKDQSVKKKKIVLPVVLCGCGSWFVTLMEEGAEENIWTSGGGSGRRLERTS